MREKKKEPAGICDKCGGDIVDRNARACYCWRCQKEVDRDNRHKRLGIGEYKKGA